MKKRGLFDHIREVTAIQKVDYFDTLSVDDRKSWSNYMVNRFLSMKMEWVELVNELQKYKLEPKELYKLYINILPKGKQWLKYTKGRNDMNYPNWLINIVANDMEVSKQEAKEAVDMYYLTEGGMAELGQLARKWGVEPKKIEKAGLNVLGSVGGYTAGNEPKKA